MHDCTSLWWYLVIVVRYLVMVVLRYDGTSLWWYSTQKHLVMREILAMCLKQIIEIIDKNI